MSIVHTESLTKVYGAAAQPVYALNAVDLAVEEGEFLAVMGPSGSGKSTLLYLIGGLDRPSSGKVWLRDSAINELNDDALSRLRRESLGFVFQFFNLIPVLTARENVAMPLILDGVPRADALKQADEALSRVGLSDRGAHRPSELSGGQQQGGIGARAGGEARRRAGGRADRKSRLAVERRSRADAARNRRPLGANAHSRDA
ncbi:MAG: ATP-binding cassette domain-containing protein [Anaerolineae bacterium]